MSKVEKKINEIKTVIMELKNKGINTLGEFYKLKV